MKSKSLSKFKGSEVCSGCGTGNLKFYMVSRKLVPFKVALGYNGKIISKDRHVCDRHPVTITEHTITSLSNRNDKVMGKDMLDAISEYSRKKLSRSLHKGKTVKPSATKGKMDTLCTDKCGGCGDDNVRMYMVDGLPKPFKFTEDEEGKKHKADRHYCSHYPSDKWNSKIKVIRKESGWRYESNYK